MVFCRSVPDRCDRLLVWWKGKEVKRYLLPYIDGNYQSIKQNRIDSALPCIKARLRHAMPLELVDVEEIERVVDYIHVKVNRNCSPEEVAQLVEQIKTLMRDALDGMPHYTRPASERGRYSDP